MLKYLPDTNILIYAIKNGPSRVREVCNRHADQLGISTVALSEHGSMIGAHVRSA